MLTAETRLLQNPIKKRKCKPKHHTSSARLVQERVYIKLKAYIAKANCTGAPTAAPGNKLTPINYDPQIVLYRLQCEIACATSDAVTALPRRTTMEAFFLSGGGEVVSKPIDE